MSEKKHWLRPLTGAVHETRHSVLWCSTEYVPAAERIGAMSARLVELIPSLVIRTEGQTVIGRRSNVEKPISSAAEVLDELEDFPRYTIWLPRGWQDLVLSGLADEIDRGNYKWKYISIDGSRLSARGEWRGKRMDLASLANWTGGAWDGWRAKLTAPDADTMSAHPERRRGTSMEGIGADELVALDSLDAILRACEVLRLGNPCGSAGAQGRQWWRAWGGPWVTETGKLPRIGDRTVKVAKQYYVAPLPGRPAAAAAAERHCCYGMTREQYRQGRVEGPIYVLDLESAYLAAYCKMACPIKFAGRMQAEMTPGLKEEMRDHQGLALVLIQDKERTYPCRRAGKAVTARGTYWTWLAGHDLDKAVQAGSVLTCQAGWLWTATAMAPDSIANTMLIGRSLREQGLSALLPVWRAVYSAAIGGFGQWARRWVDTDRESQFGRWATWIQGDPRTAELTRFRAIAGRVQYRADVGEDHRALPLVYACVLASLRDSLAVTASIVGEGNIVAKSADALWVTEAGKQNVLRWGQSQRSDVASLRTQAIYDRVWMDGAGRAVVETEGKRYAILTGVPSAAQVGDDGVSRWIACDPWSSHPETRERGRVVLRDHTFAADDLIRLNDYPDRDVKPWIELDDPTLPEELLIPLRAPSAKEDQRA